MKALILAGGFGKRLYPLTKKVSKCLLKVNGKPVIDYTFEKVVEIKEIKEVLVLTNDKFYNDFLKWSLKRDKVKLISNGINSEKESRGALENFFYSLFKEKINDDILVLGGDNVFDFSLKDAFRNFKKSGLDLAIFSDVKSINEAKRLGVITEKNGIITNFEEKPRNPKSTICSTCMYFFKKETLDFIKKHRHDLIKKGTHIGFLLEYLYKKIPIKAYIVDKNIDIGTPESLKEARLFSRRRL